MQKKYHYKMLTDEQFEALVRQGLVRKPSETSPKHSEANKTADTSNPGEIASGEPKP